MNTRQAIIAACFVLATAAHADKINVLQYPTATCSKAAADAADLIAQFPHTLGWRYAVVCDDATWDKLLAKAAPGQTQYVYGVTFPKRALTLFRATRLEEAHFGDPEPKHTVAHELAHIYLHSPDDVVVDKLALKWIADQAHDAPDIHLAATLPDGTGAEVISISGSIYRTNYSAGAWHKRLSLLQSKPDVRTLDAEMIADKGTCLAAHDSWAYGLCVDTDAWVKVEPSNPVQNGN